VRGFRARNRLSQALAALPGSPRAGVIRATLAAPSPAAVRGVGRRHARAALAVLAGAGLHGRMEPHTQPARETRFALLAAAAAVALAAALAVAVAGGRKVLHRPAAREVRADGVDASPAAAPRTARSPRDLAKRALVAAAALRCSTTGGSGFFVEPDLLVTNFHVLCPDDDSVQVGLSNDRKLVGRVVRRDPKLDLGLVRVIGANALPMPLGDAGDLAPGDSVLIVGSPVGLDFTVQEGSISSLQRSANGLAYLQLDAKVSPGNSGGPVVDSSGRVVGIVSMKVSGEGVEGIGLALPINYVYSAATAFVEPPSDGAAASDAFRRMVARAQSASDAIPQARVEAPQAEVTVEPDDRPLLVGGSVDSYDHLVVRVARITESPPPFEEITVTLWSGLETFCTVKGDIARWTPVDASAASGLDPRAAAALSTIAGARTLYVGESPLRWDLCDRTKLDKGIQVQLEGASPLASRLEVK
jgi:serine protease Do